MTQYDAKSLENLSIEDLMNIEGGDVKEFQFLNFPAGAYAGLVTNLMLPNEESPDNFQVHVQPTEVIELLQATEENFATVTEMVGDSAKLTSRYNKDKGSSRQAMFNLIAPLHIGQPAGVLFAHFQSGGEPIPVTFMVEHRLERLNAEQKAAGQQARTFVNVTKLSLA